MTTPKTQVRRATVEDLQKLGELLDQERLPRKVLEPRFKEFQVVEGPGGEILGAMGFQIIGTEGCLHSEAFAHPEQADELRGLLWERAQLQAKNHGLVRVWTQLATPFWRGTEFQPANASVLGHLPEAWTSLPDAWFYVQLRSDLPPEISIDKEFMLFREQEREHTARMMRQARLLKMIAGVVSVIVFLLVLVWAVFFFKLKYGTPPPGP